MMTQYQKGIRAEYELSNELKAEGWTVVRSAGSHGPVDLIAWQSGVVQLIQVKSVNSLPAMRRAIKQATVDLDARGAWPGMKVWFQVAVRYKSAWYWLDRYSDGWFADDALCALLGQSEWPITERSE